MPPCSLRNDAIFRHLLQRLELDFLRPLFREELVYRLVVGFELEMRRFLVLGEQIRVELGVSVVYR